MNQPTTHFPTAGSAGQAASAEALTRASPHPAGRRRIAFVSASWHREIVLRAREGLLAEFQRSGVPADRLESFEVPGAFEIPLFARNLALSGRFEAIIGCGLVVNGGIYRHEFVAAAVIDGLMRVQLDTGVPVLSAVLTPRDFHEHDEHRRFFSEHFVVKGEEVARACLATIDNLHKLQALTCQ
jgi:6,7-dimethyl-8-ribityllumazine synthase